MTTIRKIVTSKIDGDDANNTSTNEIRPFGEMAVYVDNENNGGVNKLELLMFDGVRTHLRSKVLSKGTFYGGDADSADQGDGIENLDTIKLIPDAELHYNDGDYGNDQYIVIDPTLPNHIHVRAGGAIDSSTATLFLGGEENNVMVSDSADQVAITTNDTHTWLFGTDGKLTVPANSSILTNETALKIATHSTTTYTFNQAYWEALNGNATRMFTPTGNAQYFSCTVTANQDGTYTVGGTTGNSFAPGNWFKVPGNELGGVTPANDIQINIATVDGAGVILTTTITGTAVGKQWQFGTDGNLTLPGTLTLPQGGTITEGGGFTGAIKLTPAGGANEYQSLVIYPTAAAPDGDHLHLTAGGGTTELYLGNDFHYVKLVDGGNIEVRATHPDSSTAAWTFDTDGNIDTRQALGIKVPNGVPSSVTAITTTTASWELNPLSNLATTGGSGSGLTVTVTQTAGYATAIAIATAGTGYTAGDFITVVSGTSTAYFTIAVAGRNTWLFGEDGNLTAPGNLQVDGGKIILNTGDNAYVESVDYGVNTANSAVNIFGGPYQKIKLRAGFGTQAIWTFGTDGTLTFPDASVQTKAWAGIPGPYADDAAAATAGVAVNYPYHKTGTGGQVFVRLT